MKKLTNRERCRKCIHRRVCKFYGTFDGIEWVGERCGYYKPREKKEKGADDNTK